MNEGELNRISDKIVAIHYNSERQAASKSRRHEIRHSPANQPYKGAQRIASVTVRTWPAFRLPWACAASTLAREAAGLRFWRNQAAG